MSDKGDWSPNAKYRAYISRLSDILENGEERTVRDCYYALEARGFESDLASMSYEHQRQKHERDPDTHEHPDDLPPETWMWSFEYRYVKRAVKRGRRAGYIDPSQIIDASRSAETLVSGGWSSPEDFIETEVEGIWDRYWENFWAEQDAYLEVWLEKQSLASVFAPICQRHNVRLEATRGDWSDSKVYEAVSRLGAKLQAGKDVRVLYFGDYNPSGFHAPVSILDAMGYYGMPLSRPFPQSDERAYYDCEFLSPFSFNNVDGTFGIERLALTTDQIARFELPENPVPSSTDKDTTIKEHFQQYVSDGRDTNVELNALKEYHRDYLEDLVEDGITQHIDPDARDRVHDRIETNRAALADCITIDRDALSGEESR